jgi:predicted secreted protein
MSAAISAKGVALKIGSTAVAEVTAINGLNLKLGTQEVTSHASTNGWKEFIATLKEFGCTLDINYVPTENTHKNAAGGLVYLLCNPPAGGQAFSIVWPDAGNTTWGPFNAYVTDFQPKAPVSGNLSASITLQGTGQPTLA